MSSRRQTSENRNDLLGSPERFSPVLAEPPLQDSRERYTSDFQASVHNPAPADSTPCSGVASRWIQKVRASLGPQHFIENEPGELQLQEIEVDSRPHGSRMPFG